MSPLKKFIIELCSVTCTFVAMSVILYLLHLANIRMDVIEKEQKILNEIVLEKESLKIGKTLNGGTLKFTLEEFMK